MSDAKFLGYLRWCLPRPARNDPPLAELDDESQRIHYRSRFERVAFACLLLQLRKLNFIHGFGWPEFSIMADEATTQLRLELMCRDTVFEHDILPQMALYNRDDADERERYENLCFRLHKDWILDPLAEARQEWRTLESETAFFDIGDVEPRWASPILSPSDILRKPSPPVSPPRIASRTPSPFSGCVTPLSSWSPSSQEPPHTPTRQVSPTDNDVPSSGGSLPSSASLPSVSALIDVFDRKKLPAPNLAPRTKDLISPPAINRRVLGPISVNAQPERVEAEKTPNRAIIRAGSPSSSSKPIVATAPTSSTFLGVFIPAGLPSSPQAPRTRSGRKRGRPPSDGKTRGGEKKRR
ncbi:MAG: hypothetical protein Q9209_005026 [Squamulea sp. 1 TL-2023]